MERRQQIENWLRGQLPGVSFSLSPASSDASFRRYFRAETEDGSYIVMDAPPDKEDCRPFINVARLFSEADVNLPRVLAEDLEQGLLLLTDLGSSTYLDLLAEENARHLYGDAVDSLIKIQLLSRPGILPEYDEAMLGREIDLFRDWYVARELGKEFTSGQAEIFLGVKSAIIENNLAQPRVFVHRDYHSRNLMHTTPNPGILDFQDAVYGPITYDLVSLFRDAYIGWGEEQVLDWVIRYWEKARRAGLPVASDFYEFYRDFEWMGAQRQLKVIGIFSRLAHRDGKHRYLEDIPLVMEYLKKTCLRYQALSPLLRLIDELEGKGEIKAGYTF